MARRGLLGALAIAVCLCPGACRGPDPGPPPAPNPSFVVEEQPERVLLVTETEGLGGPAVAGSARALETLIAHFEERCAVVPAASYEAGRLGDYLYVFYLAGKPDARARDGFASDLAEYEGTAVWVGPGAETLGEPALASLGLEVKADRETLPGTVPWTISYGGRQHVERVSVPAVAAGEGAEVLAEARRGGEARPFLAGKERRWYAAAGPAMEQERFWTRCVWADALHEMLGEAHEGEGKRVICALRDVPIWCTRRQVPAAVEPILAARVPVVVMASTHWGEVPLGERPEAIQGLRSAESLSATVALVSDGRVDAREEMRLAWEVGLNPVAWGGPADGENPFRLRIAGLDESPPYNAGGLLPGAIAISDAGYIAPEDAGRLRMLEVVRDAVALVSFGLWAPPEPYLEFLGELRARGWKPTDLREMGVRVEDSRRTVISGEGTVRTDGRAEVRRRVLGPRWEVVEEEVLARGSGATAHQVSAPGRSVVVLELARRKAAREFIRGVTLDPGAYSGSGMSGKELAETLAERYQENGVNTVFVYAYNVDEGAAYRTRYRGASVSEWGEQDLLAHMLEACHARDVRVVAWLYSGRDRGMWQEHPEWRELGKDGRPHNPLRLHAAYFLCARNPEVRDWYSGLLRDLGRRYPTLDGIELCEPVVNWFGDQACYCSVCNREFAAAHPGEPLGGDAWRDFRAEGLTEFLSQCMQTIAEQGIDSYMMTISDALDNGAILSPRRQAYESGLDLEALLDGPYPPDWVNFEIIWQQWAAIYGREVFNTDWGAETAQRLVRRVDGRARVVLHVELTDFGSQRMTPADIGKTIERVQSAGPDGIECYHSGAVDRKRAWPVLRRSYERLP